MATHTIFYSWQSDIRSAINRTFIEDCLERAIDDLKDDESLEVEPCLDRDTSGIPGSPDIAATIFEKIRQADVFVGDVTFIDNSVGRRTPNPNVLIELGYAAATLEWDRIICVFNTFFGSIAELPFDLRQRRVIAYKLTEGEEKSEQRSALASKLRLGIQSIIHAPDQEAQEALRRLMSSLASELIDVITSAEEFDERSISPWLDSMRLGFGMSADHLRRLALTDVAQKESLAADLESLGDVLDSAANLRLHSGSWPELSSLVEKALQLATAIKAKRLDSVPLSPESVREARATLETTRRQLEKLVSRLESLLTQGRYGDAQSEASSLGLSLLRASFYDIESRQFGRHAKLQEIGRDLHLVETMQVYLDGGRSINAIAERIQKNSQALTALLATLQ